MMMMISTRCDMEGRITTPPTMSGVQKRASQGKAEGMSRPFTCETCEVQRLPSKAGEKHCLWGKRNRYARAQGNLDANKQERMIRANFIPALCWDWPIMPGKIMPYLVLGNA
jgi:hypothetical protein